jgi:hypothetical protein
VTSTEKVNKNAPFSAGLLPVTETIRDGAGEV